MKRSATIWLLYALVILTVFFCSSCAGSKPKYKASEKVVAVRENKRQENFMTFHLWILIMTGFIYHVTNEDSK